MNKGQKIPEIIVSNTEDSINGGNLVYKLTLEEFYDLMHHTHKASDIIIEGQGTDQIDNIIIDNYI